MISSRLAIGVFGSYSKSDQKQTALTPFGLTQSTRQSFGVGPFLRYYQPITDKFYFFAQGDAGYSKYEMTQTIASDPETRKDNFTTTRIARYALASATSS